MPNSESHKGLIPWNKGLKGLPARHTTPHSDETKLRISLSKKGKPINRIKGISEETRCKIRNTLRKGDYVVCKVCDKSFFCSPSTIKKGRKYCSNKCQGEDFKGEKNPLWNHKYATGSNAWNWKGGINKYPCHHIKNKKYKIWRKNVFVRDNYICQKCFLKSGKGITVFLHPHHIFSYTYYPKIRYSINNGITLCIDCHRETHSILNKGVQNRYNNI